MWQYLERLGLNKRNLRRLPNTKACKLKSSNYEKREKMAIVLVVIGALGAIPRDS